MRKLLAGVLLFALATLAIGQGTVNTRPLPDIGGWNGQVTGTGKAVLDTSPTLVTPTLGAATATSLITTGATNAGNTGALDSTWIFRAFGLNAKAGAAEDVGFIGSSDASGPLGLRVSAGNNATPGSRYVDLQSVEPGVAQRVLRLNGSNVQVSATGVLTAAQGVIGSATNDSATAGNIGEYQEVNCGIPAASGASLSFTNASPTVGTWTSHPFGKTGVAYGSYACPFTITANAPTGLSTSTNYWATPIDANTFHVSTSAANAAAGTWANTTGSTSTSNLTNSIALTTTAGLSPVWLNLTAGDWDCQGSAIRVLGATTSVTNMQTGINSSSTAIGGLGTYFDFETAANIMTATSNPVHSTPTVRLSLSATTAEYLVALDTFTASTNTVSGFLRCRRMR